MECCQGQEKDTMKHCQGQEKDTMEGCQGKEKDTIKMRSSDVTQWTCWDVEEWLIQNNFKKYVECLIYEHELDGPALLSVTELDLRNPPVEIKVLGDIKRLYASIKKLQLESKGDNSCTDSVDGTFIQAQCVKNLCSSSKHNVNRMFSSETVSDNDDEMIEEEIQKLVNESGRYSRNLDPEIFKTALSFVYVFTVFLITSFVMTVVHDRVPDPKKYPPLPDLFIDNIPYIPWAFEVCEFVGVSMFGIWCCILFFHKHRFILMRRMFSMLGTVFLLRCVTMLITSLSVPGVHLKCSEKFGSWYAKLTRTYEIWSGFGMSIQGVKSCGDYMFSGHTSCITLLNFFITEYTPRKMYHIHTFAWVANLFGIFFILAAHEHYSIDVFIAFYITSRLFLYYHTLANNRSLMARDKHRRRIWFPLFSYFESKCDGIVPNVYEWPFPYPICFVRLFEKKTKRH